MSDLSHDALSWFGILMLPVFILAILYFLVKKKMDMPKVWSIGMAIVAGFMLFWHEDLVEIEVAGAKARIDEVAKQVEAEGSQAIAEIRQSLKDVNKKLTGRTEILEASFTETEKRLETIADTTNDTRKSANESVNAIAVELATVRGQVKRASDSLIEVKQFVDLLRASIRASANSRNDLEHLKAVSEQEGRSDHLLALDVYKAIIQVHPTLNMLPKPDPGWMRQTDIPGLSINEFFDAYQREQYIIHQQEMLWYNFWRDSWDKNDKNTFFVKVLEAEDNLIVLRLAGSLFDNLNGLGLYPLQYEEMLEWWESEKREQK